MREFRFLEDKRNQGNLSQVEESRWLELREALGIQDPAAYADPNQAYAQPQQQGYWASDGNWYPYPAQQPQGYDAQAYAQQNPGYDPSQYPADPNAVPQDPNQAYAYPQQGYDPYAAQAQDPAQWAQAQQQQAYDPYAQAQDPAQWAQQQQQQAYDPYAQAQDPAQWAQAQQQAYAGYPEQQGYEAQPQSDEPQQGYEVTQVQWDPRLLAPSPDGQQPPADPTAAVPEIAEAEVLEVDAADVTAVEDNQADALDALPTIEATPEPEQPAFDTEPVPELPPLEVAPELQEQPVFDAAPVPELPPLEVAPELQEQPVFDAAPELVPPSIEISPDLLQPESPPAELTPDLVELEPAPPVLSAPEAETPSIIVSSDMAADAIEPTETGSAYSGADATPRESPADLFPVEPAIIVVSDATSPEPVPVHASELAPYATADDEPTINAAPPASEEPTASAAAPFRFEDEPTVSAPPPPEPLPSEPVDLGGDPGDAVPLATNSDFLTSTPELGSAEGIELSSDDAAGQISTGALADIAQDAHVFRPSEPTPQSEAASAPSEDVPVTDDWAATTPPGGTPLWSGSEETAASVPEPLEAALFGAPSGEWSEAEPDRAPSKDAFGRAPAAWSEEWAEQPLPIPPELATTPSAPAEPSVVVDVGTDWDSDAAAPPPPVPSAPIAAAPEAAPPALGAEPEWETSPQWGAISEPPASPAAPPPAAEWSAPGAPPVPSEWDAPLPPAPAAASVPAPAAEWEEPSVDVDLSLTAPQDTAAAQAPAQPAAAVEEDFLPSIEIEPDADDDLMIDVAPPPPPSAPVVVEEVSLDDEPTLDHSHGLPAFGDGKSVLNASFIEGEHRVIIHTLEGQVKRGVIRDLDLQDEAIPLEQQTGFAPERIPTNRVKAIFFMLPPGDHPPAAEGKKIRVTFRDGRQVAGFSNDFANAELGFFMMPADNRTNTARIYIFRSSVQAIAPG